MKRKFTQENLLQFIYGEVSPDEHLEMIEALDNDERLYHVYATFCEEIASLKELELSPSKTTIKILLEESSESSTLEGMV